MQWGFYFSTHFGIVAWSILFTERKTVTSKYQLACQKKIEYIPTPDEIRVACLRIQKEWTPQERRKRVVQVCGRVELPTVTRSRSLGISDD